MFQIVVVCAVVAACQAGLLHHAPAVSSQNIVRHDQTIHHEVPIHYSAPVYHAAPSHAGPIHSGPIHAAPIHTAAIHSAPIAIHAAPAHHEDHYVDEYVSIITIQTTFKQRARIFSTNV